MQQVGRIAFRKRPPVDGEPWMWCAYWAEPDTMDGAVFLGSIALALVDGNPEVRRLFMETVKVASRAMLEAKTGGNATWGGEKPAPFWETPR